MDDPAVTSSVLVARVDGLGLPVGPVQEVVEERQREGVGQRADDDLASVGPVELAAVDEAELGVGPVDARLVVVEGEAVGPVDVVPDDDRATLGSPVHPRTLDLGNLTPVRPVHVAVTQGGGQHRGQGSAQRAGVSTGNTQGWSSQSSGHLRQK